MWLYPQEDYCVIQDVTCEHFTLTASPANLMMFSHDTGIESTLTVLILAEKCTVGQWSSHHVSTVNVGITDSSQSPSGETDS